MPKRTTTFELTLPARDPSIPAHRWLYEALRVPILEGRLRPGARLPSTRELSIQGGLSRGTVVSAFEQLGAEGYIESTTGSGTYVSHTLPDALLRVPLSPVAGPSAPRAARPRLSVGSRRTVVFPGYESRPTRAFRPNVPALDEFPTSLWAQLTARRFKRASTSFLLGCGPMGYPPLQEAVSDYLGGARGVRCAPAQVMITSGIQEALDLASRLLLDPGDRACMEDPGYPGAALVFEAYGARIKTVPSDAEGMNPNEAVLRGARLVYATPAHQFPLGTTMSLGRRLKLVDWARQSGGLVFEDDYDSEFRYSGRPIPALQGLDPGGLHVLFGGSFSKVLFPSLRLGYLVVPDHLVEPFEALKSLSTRHAPLVEQATLCDFIVQGQFARHVRRMRQIYAERLALLLEGARRYLGGLLEISSVEAGLQTTGWLGPGMDAESAAAAAAARGVEVTPLSRYCRRASCPEGLQLGFAPVDAIEIERGVQELATALACVAKAAKAPEQEGTRKSRDTARPIPIRKKL